MTTDINAEERARRAQEAKLKAEIARRMAEEAAREAEEAERQAEQAANAGDTPETPEKPAEALKDADSADDTDSGADADAKPEESAKSDDTPDDDTPDDDAKDAEETPEASTVTETTTEEPAAADSDADAEKAEKADTPKDEDDSESESDAKPDGKKKRKRSRQAEIVDVDEDDSPSDENPAKPAKAGKPRREGGFFASVSGTVWALIAVNIALAAGLGGFLYGKSTIPDDDKDNKTVQFAATRAAEDISSYDYRTIDSDLKRAAAHTTGNFKAQFDQQITQVKGSATQQQAVVEGQAVKTAVESVDGDKAIALVYLDQTTAKQATASRTPNQYTLRMVMKKIKGQWLVSDLQML